MKRGSTDEWVKTCLHKKRYNEGLAEHLVNKIKMERGVELRKYYCPYCAGWHLTKKGAER